MDGKELLYRLRHELGEPSNSGFLDTYTSYEYLWEAAIDFAERSFINTASQSITTVADQTDYTLNADYLQLWIRDSSNRLVLKYNDGSNDSFIYFDHYEDIYTENLTTSVTYPQKFAILDDSTLDSQVTGTATSAAAASGGQSTLTDTAADFADVSPGDRVHNTTDGSDGIVISKTSSTVLVTALFNGTNSDWSSSDAYVIQPQGRKKIVLNQPPSTAGHTITVPYVQRPAPVFSDYGMYRFPTQYHPAIVKYAAFLYRYRDDEPNFGDALFKFYDNMIGKAVSAEGKSLNTNRLKVNLKARGKNS